MVCGLEVTICQGMHSSLGDPPSIPSSYVYPAKTPKLLLILISKFNQFKSLKTHVEYVYVSLFE